MRCGTQQHSRSHFFTRAQAEIREAGLCLCILGVATPLAAVVVIAQLIVFAANYTATHDRAGNRQAERDEYRDPDEKRVLADPGVHVVDVTAGVGVRYPADAVIHVIVGVLFGKGVERALVSIGHVAFRLTVALAVRVVRNLAVEAHIPL